MHERGIMRATVSMFQPIYARTIVDEVRADVAEVVAISD
jgi:hypothetical protein